MKSAIVGLMFVFSFLSSSAWAQERPSSSRAVYCVSPAATVEVTWEEWFVLSSPFLMGLIQPLNVRYQGISGRQLLAELLRDPPPSLLISVTDPVPLPVSACVVGEAPSPPSPFGEIRAGETGSVENETHSPNAVILRLRIQASSGTVCGYRQLGTFVQAYRHGLARLVGVRSVYVPVGARGVPRGAVARPEVTSSRGVVEISDNAGDPPAPTLQAAMVPRPPMLRHPRTAHRRLSERGSLMGAFPFPGDITLYDE